MKAILINSNAQTVTLVDVNPKNFLDDAHRLIDCDCFCLGGELDNGDHCLVDDEGLLKGKRFFFKWEGYPHNPLAGNGLVCGSDRNGETVDVKTSLEAIKAKVSFFCRIGRTLINLTDN